MSLLRNDLFGLCFAVALLGGTSAAAEVLIVRSVGPSTNLYPVGRRLADSARITLKTSDQLVLLDARGTRELRGPGAYSAAAGSAPGRIASATPTQQGRARIGAVRGVDTGPLRPPTLWHVDVARAGTVCVSDPARIALWRADASTPLALTVAGGGASRSLTWPAGQNALDWPAGLPIAEGLDYRLSRGGGAWTMIHFHTLAGRPEATEEVASALIGGHCTAQLDLLVETLRIPPAG